MAEPIRRRGIGSIAVVVILLASVASACGGPIGSEAAEDICAGTTYSGCVERVTTALGAGWNVFAICEYANGGGDVVLLDAATDAETKCSGGGLITPSKVFSVLTR